MSLLSLYHAYLGTACAGEQPASKRNTNFRPRLVPDIYSIELHGGVNRYNAHLLLQALA